MLAEKVEELEAREEWQLAVEEVDTMGEGEARRKGARL